MAQELTEELRVLVTAEVEKAVKNLKRVDTKTSETEKLFKKLGTSIASAFTVKAIVSFASETVMASQRAQATLNVLNQTITATGANAWTSSKELQQMASDLQLITNYADDEIQAMQSVLLGFKNIKGDNFREATEAILDMATVMGMDLKSAAQSIGKALDDPIKGMDSLKKQGFNFTDAQKEVIQAMLDMGDIAGAQKIVLDELTGTFGGAAKAGANAATQIKNAWGDLKEGVGDFLTGFLDDQFGQKIVKGIEYIADAFATFHDNVAYLRMEFDGSERAWEKWCQSLDQTQKIEATKNKIAEMESQLKQLSDDTLGPSVRDEIFRSIELTNIELEQIWRGELKLEDILSRKIEYRKNDLQMLEWIVETDKKQAQQEADRLAAVSDIEEIMYEIATSYEKLSKSDPLVQLENYEKELEKIKKQRDELSLTTTGIDTSEALKQLEYNENAIRQKMKEIRDSLQIEGRKSWKDYYSEITGVDRSLFNNGKEAAELYLSGLETKFKNAQELSKLLGKKFDMKKYLEDQMTDIESNLSKLLEIPADKIDEIFSKADNSVSPLIDKYMQLKDELENLSPPKDFFDSWDEMLNTKILAWITNLHLFEENIEESNKTLVLFGVQLANIAGSAAMDFLKDLGASFAAGDKAASSMAQSLGDMAQKIMDQLPLLFLQAGLNLIAQGQVPLGLGFVGAAGSSAIIDGFVNKKISSKAEANALGGVYGSTDYEAFAKGGAFTNSIVSRPTVFRFAKGSGFGTGLMGEAGPEAIMPLERGPDGTLGVRSSGTSANVLVVIKNYSGAEVQTSESTENGQRRIDVMIGAAINSHISSGKADKVMSSRYGIRAQGV